MFKYEHLLVLPVPFRQQGQELMVEAQARHGLERWLDHFETLALAAPLMPESIAVNMRETQWVVPEELVSRVHFKPLPWAYRPDQFMRYLPRTITALNQLIEQSRYLQFAISGFWGDWAAIAAEMAMKQKRVYAVHTDNVCHEYILCTTNNLSFAPRWRAKADVQLMKAWHKRIVRQCDLGLFHGMDTYQAYSPWMALTGRAHAAHSIHNIHDEGLSHADVCEISAGEPIRDTGLKILYAGRMAPEKAPLDWLNALRILGESGVAFKAVWAGDGPLRELFFRHLQHNDLTDRVDAPGFVSARGQIARMYRQADIFVFTHITPESPRCLLEALKFGVPIVGYDSAYARDLISRHGGGVLVASGDWNALAHAIAALVDDSTQLSTLKEKAIGDGKRFTSHAVFSERAELIKKHLLN